MNLRRFLLEAATIIVAAVLCAVIANAIASRERKLALVGSYPNARVVPKRAVETTAPSPASMMTTPTPAIDTAATTTQAAPPIVAPVATTTIPATATSPVVPTPRPTATATAAPIAKPVAAKAAADEMLARFPVHEKVPYVEISPEDAAWLHAHGAMFLDARRTSVYEQGHIAGARSFPVWESDIDQRVDALVNEGRDQRLPIVAYCSGGDCEDSHMLAQKLWGMFFNNVLVYKDGFPDWQKRGGAVDTGSKP